MVQIDDYIFEIRRNDENNPKAASKIVETSLNNSSKNMSLVIPKGIVVVDIDTPEIADKLFNIYGSKTHWVKTTRGYHFYFKLTKPNSVTEEFKKLNCFKSGTYTLTMIPVDYKANLPEYTKNNTEKISFVTVKVDGVIRESGNNNIMELPRELYPITTAKPETVEKYNTLNIEEGGRSNNLMSYAGFLKHQIEKYYQFSQDIKNECIRFINTYFVNPPLEEKELKNIIKYESSNGNIENNHKTNVKYVLSQNKQFENKQTYSPNTDRLDIIGLTLKDDATLSPAQERMFLIIDLILSEYNLVVYGGTLYIKHHDITQVNYKAIKDEIYLLAFLQALGFLIASRAFVSEMLFHLKARANILDDMDTPYIMPVVFQNGWMINQEVGEIIPYDNSFTNNVIPTDYIPNREYTEQELENIKKLDDFIEFVSEGGMDDRYTEVHKQEVKDVIYMILGHCLMTTELPQYAYFFVGNSGANGKSTLFKMITEFIGYRNITATSLKQFDENYMTALMENSLVNVADDIDKGYIESSNVFKSVTTGETITVREINKAPRTVRLYSTLLFNCNEMPKFADSSGGITRRLKIIPMKKSIPKSKRDLRLLQSLNTPEVKQRLVEYSLKGLEMIKDCNGNINFGEIIEDETEEYFNSIDDVKGFLNDVSIRSNLETKNKDVNKVMLSIKINNELTKDIYNNYENYMERTGKRKYTMSISKFEQNIVKNIIYVKINKKESSENDRFVISHSDLQKIKDILKDYDDIETKKKLEQDIEKLEQDFELNKMGSK